MARVPRSIGLLLANTSGKKNCRSIWRTAVSVGHREAAQLYDEHHALHTARAGWKAADGMSAAKSSAIGRSIENEVESQKWLLCAT